MTVEHIELLVEEPSMEALLRGILPRILGKVTFEVYPSQCKEELLERLPVRLRAYAQWLPESWRLVVVVDRDDDDCHELKKRLEIMASTAGLMTRSRAAGPPYAVVNRIAIEELEAWYFGDWEAVCEAYPRLSRTIPMKAKYRDPDGIRGGTWEAFARVLKAKGYFAGGFRKIEAAKELSQYMDPSRNRSRSFTVFHSALVEMVTP
ncbi:MAG: DUF4276 family protein [bacterium]|nr:DUF4276 family protein [bacterium]